jgi:hypothetical protein
VRCVQWGVLSGTRGGAAYFYPRPSVLRPCASFVTRGRGAAGPVARVCSNRGSRASRSRSRSRRTARCTHCHCPGTRTDAGAKIHENRKRGNRWSRSTITDCTRRVRIEFTATCSALIALPATLSCTARYITCAML